MVQVTYEALADMLGIPKGHVITAIVPQDATNIASQSFSIIVSGPQLPQHYEGSCPPFISIVRDCGKTYFS